MTGKTEEQARKEATEFFKGDTLAADAFIDKYALQSEDGTQYLETTPEHMWKRLAKGAASVEKDKKKWEKEFYNVIKDFKAVPQGSVMFALGNPYQNSSNSNCFVFDVEDSIEGIFDTAKEMARTYSYRGGCGVDISPLRPSSARVSNSAKVSSGAASFMEFYSDVTRMMGIHGRRGALMLSIGIDHPDVELFTEMKQDLTKVTGANVSIRISDDFMRAVQGNKKWTATFETNHETITREWKARDLWKTIVHSATEFAEPGILFWDNIIKNSPADIYADEGFKTISTNPCAELPLSKYDSCTLLSMNLTRYTRNDFKEDAYFDEETFFQDTYTATRLLDNVKTIDCDKVPLPEQRDIATKGRRIGMGTHGLADALANLRIKYDSKEGVKFISDLFEKYTKAVYAASASLAKEKGAFPIFDAKKEKGHPFLERIGAAGIPRRNIACMTLAPTGTVSIISQTSSGIEPVFRVRYTRRKKLNHNVVEAMVEKMEAEGNEILPETHIQYNGKQYWVSELGDISAEYEVFESNPKRYLETTKEENLAEYFVTSDQIDWKKRVEIQAAITHWLDHSCSSTVNLPKGTSEETVSEIYMEAWKSGCKGMTVYVDGCRDGVLVTEEQENQNKSMMASQNAVVRPRKIPCDIYNITADGHKWIVMIGKVDGHPYEVFCGKPKSVDVGKFSTGYIEKEKKSKYSLHIGVDTLLEDISSIFNDTQGVLSRLISMNLRHGVDIHYIVQQLEKSDGSITSFSKAISRVLKKYIKEGAKEKGATCQSCNEETLIREEGCIRCTSCAWTKCM